MKIKFGFTLAEVLLFLVIVGVVLTVTLRVTKPQKVISEKAIKARYAAAYDALNIAAYEIIKTDETNPFEQNTDLKKYKKLCEGLTYYINTTDENCEANPPSTSFTYMQDESLDFKEQTPTFIALNGMRFFISKLITDNYQPITDRGYYNESDPDYTMSFFIVYVDITGSEKPSDPHTIQYDETSDEFPDVYAFAILPTGDAIPLGLPEFNDRILTAKVAYKKDHITYYTQDTYSYRQAKNAAWKYYTNNNSKYFFDKKISFTYNDFIQDILSRNSSKIYTSIDTQNYNYYRSGKSVYLSECKPDSDTALTAYNICSVQLQTPNFNY